MKIPFFIAFIIFLPLLLPIQGGVTDKSYKKLESVFKTPSKVNLIGDYFEASSLFLTVSTIVGATVLTALLVGVGVRKLIVESTLSPSSPVSVLTLR